MSDTSINTGSVERRPEDLGQRQRVVLPTKISEEDKTVLEIFGVKFLGPVDGDQIFQHCELPAGWSKTGAALWSYLVDDKGRTRAHIYYRSEAYYRRSHLSLIQRFRTRLDFERLENRKEAVSTVLDGELVIYTSAVIPQGKRKSYEASYDAVVLAVEWLENNYPGWQNVAAYWD